jgi:AmmeMemoRadiSam system protein B
MPAIEDLRKTKVFGEMKAKVDEAEHSLEMHLPYIRHIFKGYVSLCCIFFGAHLSAMNGRQ